MTELIQIKGTTGEYLVPVLALKQISYFRDQLNWNGTEGTPAFLYLPFPAAVLDHLIGFILHGVNWTFPSDDVHLALAFRYCGLNHVSRPAQQIKAIPVRGRMFQFNFNGDRETLISVVVPEIFCLYICAHRGRNQIIYHNSDQFYTAFRVLEGKSQLDPRCLDILNQSGEISIIIGGFTSDDQAGEITICPK